MSVYSYLADTEARIDGEYADHRDRFELATQLRYRLLYAMVADDPGAISRLCNTLVDNLPTYAAGMLLEALAREGPR